MQLIVEPPIVFVPVPFRCRHGELGVVTGSIGSMMSRGEDSQDWLWGFPANFCSNYISPLDLVRGICIKKMLSLDFSSLEGEREKGGWDYSKETFFRAF